MIIKTFLDFPYLFSGFCRFLSRAISTLVAKSRHLPVGSESLEKVAEFGRTGSGVSWAALIAPFPEPGWSRRFLSRAGLAISALVKKVAAEWLGMPSFSRESLDKRNFSCNTNRDFSPNLKQDLSGLNGYLDDCGYLEILLHNERFERFI